jgi:nucleotide sugar dehydrogenase
MDCASAELTKYAANAMLATRISFMNEVANVSELVGADIDGVRRAMGADRRIGTSFLFPGVGYGGSCFPKDVKAMIHFAAEKHYDFRVLHAVEEVNAFQKTRLFTKIKAHFGALKGKTVAVWGLAFKPRTDDMREAPAIALIESLLGAGVTVQAYDPEATKVAKEISRSPSSQNGHPGSPRRIALPNGSEVARVIGALVLVATPAQGLQVVGIIGAPFGPRDDVIDIERPLFMRHSAEFTAPRGALERVVAHAAGG